MAAVLAVLCAVAQAECRITASADDFLRKALRTKKSLLSGFVSEHGATPLGVASSHGCPSYLKDLVEAGCDINGLNKDGYTALCIASLLGELEVVTELIELGADMEVACTGGKWTALIGAADEGRTRVVERLVQAGARVNAQDERGTTALYFAAQGNYTGIIEVLLDAGADPNLFEELEAPLHIAAFKGAIEAAKILAWRGANLEARFNGRTALHAAASANSTRIVRVLVEAGADVEAVDFDGRNALYHAALKGNVGMLRFLKAAGSWLHTPDSYGQTVLHAASCMNNTRAVREILSWRAVDVDARADRSVTALHIAAAEGFVDVVELLVDAGADVDAIAEDRTAGDAGSVLRVAAISDRSEVVQVLLKAGAEIDASDDVLVAAAQRGCQRTVEVLLQARDWPGEAKALAKALLGMRAGL
jgi:ankyrin repeat protein